MKKSASKIENWSIDQLSSDYKDRINLDPPYQRKFCWPTKYQVELIKTIIDGDSINSIRLVEQENINFIVLDGKQRLSTILMFLKSDFSIEVVLSDVKGIEKTERVTYAKLQEMANNKTHKYHDSAFALVHKIRTYRLECVVYEDMSLDDQLKQFNRINFSKELKQQEKAFSKFFYAKIFFEYLMRDGAFKALSQRSKDENDDRSRDLVWALRLFYLIFGHEGMNNGKPTPSMERLLNSSMKEGSNLQKFLEALNNKIKDYVSSHKDEMIGNIEDESELDKMIAHFEWNESLKEVKKYFDIIGKDFFVNKVNSWSLIYLSGFFMKKVYVESVLTYNQFLQNKDLFKQMSTEYLKWVASNPNGTRRQAQKNHYSSHVSKMTDLYAALKIDHGVKTKHIPQQAKDLAKLEADGICEVCKRPLTKDNTSIDHLNASSLYSDTKYKAICRECNRKKSDNNSESVAQIQTYMTQNGVI